MNFQNKHILVTGGAGFIGSNLIHKLLGEKAIIHVLIKNDTNIWRLNNIKRNLYIHKANLNNFKNLRLLAHKFCFDYIYHLAAYGSNSYQSDLHEMISTNIVGLSNLLLALNDIKYKAFINTGSSSEYGFKDYPMKESDVLIPNSFYSATKGSATLLCQSFAKIYNKPIITLRPFSIYGPGEPKERFIPTAIDAFIKNTALNLTPGTMRRDFTYINDFIDAYMIAAKHANEMKGEIINIGTGRQYANHDVVKTLEKLFNKTIPVHIGAYPKRSWDANHWVANTKKAYGLLGWKAKYTLLKGLEETIKYFQKQ